jgi:hypothetical protein
MGVASLFGNLHQMPSIRWSAADVVAHGGKSVTDRTLEPWLSGLAVGDRRSPLD